MNKQTKSSPTNKKSILAFCLRSPMWSLLSIKMRAFNLSVSTFRYSIMLNIKYSILLVIFLVLLSSEAKFHYVQLKNEIRKNVQLSKFGFDEGGIFEIAIDLTVPTAVIQTDDKTDKFGIMGFTLSRGNDIVESTRRTPHLCNLNQQDQNFDAIFFVLNFEEKALIVQRSGRVKSTRLCPDVNTCLLDPSTITVCSGAFDYFMSIFRQPSPSQKVFLEDSWARTRNQRGFFTRIMFH